jgi:hypothetical protein
MNRLLIVIGCLICGVAEACGGNVSDSVSQAAAGARGFDDSKPSARVDAGTLIQNGGAGGGTPNFGSAGSENVGGASTISAAGLGGSNFGSRVGGAGDTGYAGSSAMAACNGGAGGSFNHGGGGTAAGAGFSGTSVTCIGIRGWNLGSGSPLYMANEEVQHNGILYAARLNIWDESPAFEPGAGASWQERWRLVAACSNY